MKPELPWYGDLVALAGASEILREMVPFTVAFKTPECELAINFATGRVVEGDRADCVLTGSSSAFQKLIRGEETLQVLHIGGDVHLKGTPDKLLRLAFIFEQCVRCHL